MFLYLFLLLSELSFPVFFFLLLLSVFSLFLLFQIFLILIITFIFFEYKLNQIFDGFDVTNSLLLSAFFVFLFYLSFIISFFFLFYILICPFKMFMRFEYSPLSVKFMHLKRIGLTVSETGIFHKNAFPILVESFFFLHLDLFKKIAVDSKEPIGFIVKVIKAFFVEIFFYLDISKTRLF